MNKERPAFSEGLSQLVEVYLSLPESEGVGGLPHKLEQGLIKTIDDSNEVSQRVNNKEIHPNQAQAIIKELFQKLALKNHKEESGLEVIEHCSLRAQAYAWSCYIELLKPHLNAHPQVKENFAYASTVLAILLISADIALDRRTSYNAQPIFIGLFNGGEKDLAMKVAEKSFSEVILNQPGQEEKTLKRIIGQKPDSFQRPKNSSLN